MSNGADLHILKLENVSRRILKDGNWLTILHSIGYSFEPGGIYNIVGPSGSGKSSFLRLLNRLDEPTEGTIYYKARPLPEYKPTELRKKVSLLFQTPYLFPGTVRDNIMYCCIDMSSPVVGEYLSRVGLPSGFEDRDVEGLSVGEKQRVAIARAMVQQPEVLLLDEPTSALDPTSQGKIEKLILSLAKESSLTVIVVTHNPDQALRLGGMTLLMVGGRVLETGRTSQVLMNPETESGKKYIDKELE